MYNICTDKMAEICYTAKSQNGLNAFLFGKHKSGWYNIYITDISLETNEGVPVCGASPFRGNA